MSKPIKTEPGVMTAYRARVAAGLLTYDAAQALAAEQLQALWAKLRGYDPHPVHAPEGWFARMLRSKPVEEAQEHPHGLYIVGDVGRGKSMLMDLFSRPLTCRASGASIFMILCSRRISGFTR